MAASLSPIAKPESFDFPESLPKTRSGKILRRVLRARALGQDEGDLPALGEEWAPRPRPGPGAGERPGPRKVASSGSQVPEVSVVRLRQ